MNAGVIGHALSIVTISFSDSAQPSRLTAQPIELWRKDRRMAIYHNTAGGNVDTAASSASLQSYIASAKADISILKTVDAAAFFASEIGKSLFALLLKPEEDLNTSLSLVDLGMDSLVGIELRTWWKQAFGFDISVLEMLGMGTLEALGQHAAEGLMQAALAERGISKAPVMLDGCVQNASAGDHDSGKMK